MKRIAIPMLGLTPHGGNRVIVELANHLASRGLDVEIICPNIAATMPYVLNDNIVIRKIGPSRGCRVIKTAYFLLFSAFHLRSANVIANHFLTVPPAVLAARLFNSSYVYFVQGIEHKVFSGFLGKLFKPICEWTYSKGRLITANSFLDSQLGLDYEIIYRFNLGVSEKFLSSSENIKKYDILYFLRQEKYKRIDRFDIMLPMLLAENMKILCISQDDNLLDMYKEMVSCAVKPADDEELISLIDLAKVLLLTSDHEGFSLPPLEAMARGVPAVLFECGGPSTYCRNGENSFVIPNDSYDEALASVKLLIGDSELYTRLSTNARRTAERFVLENELNDLVNFMVQYFGIIRAIK